MYPLLRELLICTKAKVSRSTMNRHITRIVSFSFIGRWDVQVIKNDKDNIISIVYSIGYWWSATVDQRNQRITRTGSQWPVALCPVSVLLWRKWCSVRVCINTHCQLKWCSELDVAIFGRDKHAQNRWQLVKYSIDCT